MNGVAAVWAKRSVAEPCLSAIAAIGDVERKIFAQIQPRDLGAGLQHVRSAMVRNAREHADTS